MRDAVSCNCTTEEMLEKISSICADIWTGSYTQECLPVDIKALKLLHIAALTLPSTTALTLLYMSATSQICKPEDGDAPYLQPTRKRNVLKYAKGQQKQSMKIHVCKRMN